VTVRTTEYPRSGGRFYEHRRLPEYRSHNAKRGGTMPKKLLASIMDRLKYVNMADINREPRGTIRRAAGGSALEASASTGAAPRDAAAPRPPQPGDEQLLAYVELLFFAYRDFTSDPDTVLGPLGFGRAHHRVLHFVHRYPGLRVAELLQILKITKQSLARVLRDLVSAGHVEQRPGPSDRRERLLFSTMRGAELAGRLARPQIERIAATLAALGACGAEHTHRDLAQTFLYHMITPSERAAVDALMARRDEGRRSGPARGNTP
jgi:DNA-binding MarR family transcriptional regulator